MTALLGCCLYSSNFVVSNWICISSYLDDIDKSNLYLKLFKLVFGSVTLFAQENEVMLKVMLS